jgi:hypothetical protein
LVAHRLITGGRKSEGSSPWWHNAIKMAGTFHLVCLTWLLFRATSIEQAWAMLSRLGHDWTWTPLAGFSVGLLAWLAGPLLVYEAWVERRGKLLALTEAHWLVRGLVYLFILLFILYLAPERSSEFIYFQF